MELDVMIKIFDEQVSRKPDRYPFCKDFINKMWAGFWTVNEFTFQSDVQQYKTLLTDEEKIVIQNTLSAIGQIEIAVKKFWARLGDNLPHPSIVDLGLTMAHVEVIHNKAYEKLLDVLQLQDSFQKNLQLDVIKGRVNYLRKYLDKNYENEKKQYVYSLILFTLFVENVSLFSQFYVILYFNRFRNLLKDTAQQIQYTKNEEMLHGLIGAKLINTIRSEYPELFDEELEQRIYHEAREAFIAESNIIEWILGTYSSENLNSEILKEYVKNRINLSLEQISFRPIFDIRPELLEPTLWMDEELYANAMTDFFNKRPIEYSKKNMSFDAEDLF